MFIASLFIVAKIWKQPKCSSVGEWVKKLWHIYTMESIQCSSKKKKKGKVTTGMELETITLSEVIQLVKDKYCTISLMSGI